MAVIGDVLDGKYSIVAELGGGGMGSVYEARHTGTGRRVAVKVITGALAKNETFISRFHREARAGGAIESQHIVQVLDTGKDPVTELPFMVMEYLDGEDLASLFRRLGPVPPDLALRITAQACLGLQKAHDAHVVHRDIKPGNLFLTKRDDGDYIIKLLDFGIAKIKQDQASQIEAGALTRTGSMLGSPLYMSPEQARGQKTVDHRADIWSLGVVLYQALTGRRPHEDVEALGDLIIAICSELPAPVQDLAPWVPAAVAEIAHGALRFDANDRFQSAAAMLEAAKPLLPDGWKITEEMLVGLTDDQRARVEPRSTAADVTAASGLRPADPSAIGIGADATIAEAPRGSLPPPSFGPGPISLPAPPGVPRFSSPGPEPRSSASPQQGGSGGMIAAVVVAALGLGGAAYYAFGRPVPPPPAEPVVAVVTAAPRTAEPVVAPPPATTRTVRVLLVPPEASAEVDGVPADTSKGVVAISGNLGSVHRVRVFQGKQERVTEVVIAESGAVPSTVELGPAKP